MSTVDNRVVKLQFDNAQFEKNVSKSMATLDKLEEKLQFKKAAKGFETLRGGINSVDFSGVMQKVDHLERYFTTVGGRIESTFKNKIFGSIQTIYNNTLGQIEHGGWNRAMNIENAKFSIEGLKEDWNELYKAMDYAVTGTAYGIDQAATAAASLVASGVGYTEVIEKSGDTEVTAMHKALRAISGVAAQTNSDFSSIANIFTTVAGQGRLMGDQLNQLAARGMNAAAKLAEALGTTEADVRDAVSHGAIDFETFAFAMDDAFGEHATDANKTFTGSLSNMKAALSRFGAVFATPIIQKTNKFFIALTDRIKEMKNAISDVVKNGEVLEEHLESHFAQMWQNLIDLADTLVHKIDLTWFWNVADAADSAVTKIRDLLDILNKVFKKTAGATSDTAETVYDLATITAAELELAENVIKGTYGTGQKRVKALGEAAEKLGLDPVKIQKYVNAVAGYGYSFEKAGIKIAEVTDAEEELSTETIWQKKITDNYTIAFHNLEIAINNIKTAFSDLSDAFSAGFQAIDRGTPGIFWWLLVNGSDNLREFSVMVSRFSRALLENGDVLQVVYEFADSIAETLSELQATIHGMIMDVGNVITETLDWWGYTGELGEALNNVHYILLDLQGIVRNVFTTIRRITKSVLTALLRVLSPSKLTGVLLGFSDALYGVSTKLYLSEEGAERLTDVLTVVFEVVQSVVLGIGGLISNIAQFLSGIRRTETGTEKSSKGFGVLADSFEFTGTAVSILLDKLMALPEFLTELFDILENNEGVIRLKTAITTLVETIKTAISTAIRPFAESLGLIDQGDDTTTAAQKVGEAIGWIADKIAIVIEQIPTWIGAIGAFFEKVEEKVDEFKTWIGDKIDFEGIKEAITGFFNPEEGESFVENIKSFAQGLFDKVTEELDSVDWSELGENSLILGILAMIWKLLGVADTVDGVIESIGEVPEKIGEVIGNIGEVLASTAGLISNFGTASLIVSIAALVISIAGAMVLLARIPEDDLQRIGTVIVTILFAISLLTLLLKKIQDARILKIIAKGETGVKMAKIKAANMFFRFAGLALIIVSIGVMIKLIADSLLDLYNTISKVDFNGGDFALAIFVIVGIIVVTFVAALFLMETTIDYMKRIKGMSSDTNKQIVMMSKFGWILLGMAAVLAAFGVAIYLIAEAVARLSEVDISGPAVLTVVGIIAALGFAIGYIMSALTKNVRNVKAGDIFALAGVIFVFTLGLSAILLAALGIASLAMMANFGGKGGVIELILAEIMGFILVLGIAIGMIVKNVKTLGTGAAKKLWATVGIIAAIALVIVGVGYSIKMMADGFGSFDLANVIALTIALGGIVAILFTITNAVSEILAAIAKHNITANRMKMLGIVIGLVAVIGAVIVAIGYSVKLMTDNAGEMGDSGAAIIGIVSALVAALAVIMLGTVAILEAVGKNNITDKQLYGVAAVVASFGVMAILVGASFGIIASSITGLNDKQLAIAIGVLLGTTILTFGAFIGLILIMKHIGNGAEEMVLKAAEAMVLMCASLLVIAGALYILSKIEWTPSGIWTTIGAVVIVGLLFAALWVMMKSMSGTTGNSNIGKNLILAATALVIMAASLIVFAVACQMLSTIDPGILIAAAAALGIFMAVLMLGAYLLSSASVDPKILQGIALAILAVGGSVLLAAVGMALMAVVLPKLSVGLMALTPALSAFFDILESHWKAAVGIGIAIIIVLGLAVAALWAIKAVLAPVITALAEGANVILQTIGTLAGQFGNWLSRAFSGLADKAKEIGPKLGLTVLTIILAVGAALTQHGPKILQILGKLIIMVLDWAAEAIGPITSKLIDLLIKLLEGLADAISTHSNQIGAVIMKIIYALLSLVIGIVWQALRGIFSLIGGSAGAGIFDKYIGPALTTVQEGLKLMGDEQMEIARLQDAAIGGNDKPYQDWVNNLVEVDEAMAQVTEDHEKAVAANKKLEEQAASTDHTLSGLKNKFAGMFGVDTYANDIDTIDMSHLPDAAKNAMMSQGTGAWADDGKFYQFTAVANKDVAGAEEAYAGADVTIPGMEGMPDYAGEMGYESGEMYTDGYAGGVFEGQDDVVGATNSNVDAQIDAIDSRQDELKDAGKRGVNSHISGIESKAPEVAAATRTSVIGPITSTLSGFANAPISSNYGAPKLGNDVANGVISGYNEAMTAWVEGGYLTPGSAANSTYNAAQAIKDGFVGPRAMDINSPSKVTYGWGQNIIQGLTNGILNNTDDAVTSMTDLSNAMIISFGNPLDYAARIASGEIQYDPSIRPVLDTSNIARGAYGINTLFDNQNVAISGFSGKLATDITGLDTTNMSMVTELRALRSDMNAMTEQITSMQIVMDGGQLVGAIAPTMDNALGNRAAMRRRGN